MNKKEFEEYNKAQLEEIRKHKWIESERAGKDLGQESTNDWIRKYAKEFRSFWEKKSEDSKKNT